MHINAGFLVKADQISDYVPGLSTITSLVDLFQKCVLLLSKQKADISKSHYYTYLQQKSFSRCIMLLIPVIGNISVAIYDFAKSKSNHQDAMLAAAQPASPFTSYHSHAEPNREGLAIDDRRYLGKHAKSLVAGKKEARVSGAVQQDYSESTVVAGYPAGAARQLATRAYGNSLQVSSLSEQWSFDESNCCEHSLTEPYIALYPALQTKPGLITVKASAENIHMEGAHSQLNIHSNPIIQYHAASPSKLPEAEVHKRLRDLLQLQCSRCIKVLMAQGHKLLREEKGEASLQGAFYLATAYELYCTLKIREYKFDQQVLDQYLDSLEEKLENNETLLHYFAVRENTSIFLYLFNERQKVKSQLDTLAGKVIKETPLHLAANRGYTSVSQFLLDQGADIKKGRYGEYAKTVLHVAVEYGREEIVELLLQHKDIQEILNLPQGGNKHTALHLAAAKGHFSILRKLIDCGAHTEQQDLLRQTSLEILLEQESLDFKMQEECACLLLSKKTPPFFQLDNPKLTQCFINALKQGLLHVAQKLAKNGLPHLEEQERSFLEIAAHGAFQRTHTLSPEPIEIPQEKRAAYILMIRWLLAEKKVDPNQPFKGRADFLIHQVCYAGCSELLLLLIELKADLKKLDSSQNSVLHHACQSSTDCVEIVRLLLGHDPALLEAKNSYGQTPLHLAALRGNAKSAEYLLNQIAEQSELNQQDYQENTPLHLAVIGEGRAFNLAKENYVKIVEALLKKGANLNIINREQKTAVELAYKNGSEALIQLLSQAALLPKQLINSLKNLYLSQKTLSIFRIKVEQEWEFKVPLEEIYVRLGIIEREERKARDQAFDKHSEYLQDVRIPTYETIYEPKQNIDIEKLFQHKSLEKNVRKRVFIQGAAGIGKSTLCHYISYHWAKGTLWTDVFTCLLWIPLRNLTLRKYPDNRKYSAVDLIANEYEGKIDRSVFEACLNDANFRKKTLLILDGYDELSAEAQANTSLATAFKQLKELLPHILVTSRPGSCSFERSCELELLGFDKEGIKHYINRFFKYLQAEEKKQKLSHLLKASPQVLSLAQIPINLTLLCCLFHEDPQVFDTEQSITMTAIYERIVSWMYRWFLLRRIDQGQSRQTKEQILVEKSLRKNPEVVHIATAFEKMADFAMKNDTLYLSKLEIEDLKGNKISSNELTDCGFIRIPEAEEKGFFIHLTFQEFLTASKVANQYLKGERKACQEFIRNYKFEPRYNLVFRMIAGSLSLAVSGNRRYADVLQSFFDDLFTKPRDLAISGELALIAGCFEECQDPTVVKQYDGFIELVKDYINYFCLLGLGLERLLRHKNLLNHPEIVHIITELLSDPKTSQNVLENLLRVVRTGLSLASETVEAVAEGLKDPEKDLYAKRYATFILEEVAQQGGKLSKKALFAFIQAFKENDYFTIRSAASALIAMTKQRDSKLPKGVIVALIQALKKANFWGKNPAANALKAMVKQGDKLSKKVLVFLIQVLKEGDREVKDCVASVLIDMANRGYEFTRETLAALIQVLKEGDIEAQGWAASVLREKAMQSKLPKEILTALIQVLKEGDREAKGWAASVLREKAMRSKFPKEILAALIQILNEGDKETKLYAAALRAVAQPEDGLPKEVLAVLIQALKEREDEIKCFAMSVLIEMAERGAEFPKKLLATLIQALEEGDSATKSFAVKALETMAGKGYELPKEVLAALIQAFKESHWQIKTFAAGALRLIAMQECELSKGGLAALIQVLKEGDEGAKRHAAGVLGEIAKQGGELSERVLVALIRAFKEGDKETKDYAPLALGEIAKQGGKLSEEALAALIQALEEGDEDTKCYSASALGEIAKQERGLPKEALDALIQAFKEGDRRTKNYAALALEAIAKQGGGFPKEFLDVLIQAFKESHRDTKACIASALREIVRQGGELPKEGLAALVQILKGGDDETKRFTADVLEAIARQGGELPKEALDALVQALEEGDDEIKFSAAEALEAIAKQGDKLSKEALIALIQALKKADRDTKDHIARGLGEIAKQRGELSKEELAALIQAFKEGDGRTKNYIAKSLGEIAKQEGEFPKEALVVLIQALKEGDDEIKLSAADALESIVKQEGKLSEEALVALIQALKKGDDETKTFAADALEAIVEQGGRLSKEALAALIQAHKKDDAWTVNSAIYAVKKIAKQGGELPKEALAALIQALKEGNAWTAGVVAATLKKIDKKAFLKMGIEAFPLLAEFCFFAEYSFFVKHRRPQISDSRAAYPFKNESLLSYKKLREKLPKDAGVWRERLDRLSPSGKFLNNPSIESDP
ncbi:ankyrin repeat domain-containing protein [Parachlamydia sp. AcF125]|uniref:ankyrin repeat domain-containing protein n=1 Tax=Parachlamydia sp. AcF125 TaxID=2795736 RepID=UPI001BCA05E2|nr:ankyrin repeat domain-containing protein [Parachlamydia sp. AcF125]MBS4167809.1 hypothetical protein [Parachlamydia sp. AcF125]